MSDVVGVLAAISLTSTGTTTVYTCPAGKGARFKVFYRAKAGAGSSLALNCNGAELAELNSQTSGIVMYSSLAALINTATADSSVNGSTDALTCQPYQRDMWLAAGQVFQMTISSANFQSMSMQLVGAEVDVV